MYLQINEITSFRLLNKLKFVACNRLLCSVCILNCTRISHLIDDLLCNYGFSPCIIKKTYLTSSIKMIFAYNVLLMFIYLNCSCLSQEFANKKHIHHNV